MYTIKKNEYLKNENIGGYYPYIYEVNDNCYYNFNIRKMLESEIINLNQLSLDIPSIYSMLSFGYITNDNTLLNEITKLPWRSSYNSIGAIEYYDFEKYNMVLSDENTIAKDLLNNLKEELIEACKNKKNVYILLSGGMDSRVVAAVLKHLENNKSINSVIHGVTWGVNNSRDVAYAKLICEKYKWEWHYAKLDYNNLILNFNTSAIELGAEISPVHLHRYDWFKKLNKEDIVIAGSYGDSIGRAEYSSTRVEKLKPLKPIDKYSLLKSSVENDVKAILNDRLKEFRLRYPNASKEKINEYERQGHYMRRMLGNVASIIGNWTNFHQAFTSKKTAENMLKYHYSVRTDEVYTKLLKIIDPSLLNIAWARTGTTYTNSSNSSDKLSKNHHRYGEWLRVNSVELIKEHLFNGTLEKLEVFDMSHLNKMFKYWLKEPINIHSGLGDRISWLATLSIFLDYYNIQNMNYKIKVNENKINPLKLKSRFREKIYIIRKSL